MMEVAHMQLTKRRRALFLVAVVSLAMGAACGGVLIKRDLSAIPPGQIGFDDMCGLQDYFDGLEAKVTKEPFVVSSLDLEGGDGVKTMRGGRARIQFQGHFLLKHAKRVLNENWRRLPEELGPAEKFDIEVLWVEKAGVRRVVTDRPAELFIGNDSFDLPYHACLSELLYGAPLYKQRRELWGLPDPLPAGKPDASAVATAAAPDGGAAPEAGAAGPDGR
jgi:hypothetical protein